MPNQTIYLNDLMYLKLRDHKNKSGLVNKLLADYFLSEKPLIEQLKEAKIREASEVIIKEVEEQYGK